MRSGPNCALRKQAALIRPLRVLAHSASQDCARRPDAVRAAGSLVSELSFPANVSERPPPGKVRSSAVTIKTSLHEPPNLLAQRLKLARHNSGHHTTPAGHDRIRLKTSPFGSLHTEAQLFGRCSYGTYGLPLLLAQSIGWHAYCVGTRVKDPLRPWRSPAEKYMKVADQPNLCGQIEFTLFLRLFETSLVQVINRYVGSAVWR